MSLNKSQLLKKLSEVEAFASTSKLKRFLLKPYKYVYSILYSKLLNRFGDFTSKVLTETFWGNPINVVLPASVDIYLSGGKTHDSEIRLTRFLIHNLNENSVFLDVGAHYGFYTLLASQIVSKGKVISIEAASHAYRILTTNIQFNKNVITRNVALMDSDTPVEFYEFPTLYSEFNTLENTQYATEEWFNSEKVVVNKIDGLMGDTLLSELNLIPEIVKIDVERAEHRVVKGLSKFLSQSNPKIIMEFCKTERGNLNHKFADKVLKEYGFHSFSINSLGQLTRIDSEVDMYIDSLEIESDNIVYIK